MKEGLTYKTPEGQLHKVLMFDEINKQVYINVLGTLHRWVIESEYKNWVVTDTGQMPKIHVPDMPAQMSDEQINSLNKTEEDAIPITKSNEVDVCEQTTDSEGVGSGNAEPEIATEQESETKSEEEIVKPKRKYSKKK